jgi:hypothetical protein
MKRIIILIAFSLASVSVPVAAADTPWTVQQRSLVGQTLPVAPGSECGAEPILITSGTRELRLIVFAVAERDGRSSTLTPGKSRSASFIPRSPAADVARRQICTR